MTLKVKHGGVWKDASPFVKHGGLWKKPKEIFVKQGGEWKSTWKNAIVYEYTIPLEPYSGKGADASFGGVKFVDAGATPPPWMILTRTVGGTGLYWGMIEGYNNGNEGNLYETNLYLYMPKSDGNSVDNSLFTKLTLKEGVTVELYQGATKIDRTWTNADRANCGPDYGSQVRNQYVRFLPGNLRKQKNFTPAVTANAITVRVTDNNP